MLEFNEKTETWRHVECGEEFEAIGADWVYCPICGGVLGELDRISRIRRLAQSWINLAAKFPPELREEDRYIHGFADAMNRTAHELLQALKGGDA